MSDNHDWNFLSYLIDKSFLKRLFTHSPIYLLLLLISFSPSYCAADELTENESMYTIGISNHMQDQTLFIYIKEKISKTLLDRVRKSTEKISHENRFPPPLIVMLDSNGGDAEAAMEIGKIFRTYHAHVFVTNRCGSACIFSYVGGEIRQSLPSSIGIHQARVTISDRNAKIFKELDATQNETARNLLVSFDQKAYEYFDRMGIPYSLYEKIQKQKTKDLYWLDSHEIAQFSLDTESDESVKVITKHIKEQGNFEANADKVRANVRNVLKECVYLKNEPANFLKCYSLELQKININN